MSNLTAQQVYEKTRGYRREIIGTYLINDKQNNMTEKQAIQFVKLLELFIEDSGLDRIEACHKAQELLDLINEI